MYSNRIGANYNSSLTMKDIDKLVKEELKELYPNVKITCSNSSPKYTPWKDSKYVSLTLGTDCYFQSFDEWKDYIKNNLSPSDNNHVVGLSFLRIGQLSKQLQQNQDEFLEKYNNGDYSMLEEIYEKAIQDTKWKEYVLNDKGSEVYQTIEALYKSYSYDKSDAMTDYFDYGFFLSIELKDDLTQKIEKKQNKGMKM